MLKPLLLFFNVEQIRLIFLAIAAMLLSLVSVMLSRRFGKIGIAIGLALTAAWTLVGGFDAASTLPIFFSFAISLCGMLWITVTEKLDLTRAGFAFFLIGAVTVFFDFFDNPILTLGMPLVVYVLREHCEHRLSGRSCLRVLALCAMWALGYAGLWAFKWLLVAVFVGPDNLSGLSTAMTMWTGIDSSPLSTAVTPIDAFRSNINGLGWLKYLLALLLIAAVTLVVVCAIRARKRTQRFGSWVGASVILLVIASFPYVWYLVLCGHSYIHSGFICYRDQLLTFFSLSAVVVFSIGMLRSATAAQCPSAGAKTKDAVPLAARESCEGD